MKLLIGLGNPGKEYEKTRHNVGFMFVNDFFEFLNKEYDLTNWSENKKLQAVLASGQVAKEKIILAMPTTFMNNSGIAVQAILKYYKISTENLIVIHDDLDILFGNYKIQKNRSSAGHNGIKSIIEHLGTQDFHRVRIGIGREKREQQGAGADFVLDRFNRAESSTLNKLKETVFAELIRLID